MVCSVAAVRGRTMIMIMHAVIRLCWHRDEEGLVWLVSGRLSAAIIWMLALTSSMVTPGLGKQVVCCSVAEGRWRKISSPPLYHLTLYTCSPCNMARVTCQVSIASLIVTRDTCL